MTCPCACKAVWVVSPLLEVPTAAFPVASPSQLTQLLLFKEAALSGGEGWARGSHIIRWVTVGFLGAIQLTLTQHLATQSCSSGRPMQSLPMHPPFPQSPLCPLQLPS